MQATRRHGLSPTSDRLMLEVATMLLFDYVIANEDRTFMHNSHVVARGNTKQLLSSWITAKALYSHSAEVRCNPLFLPRGASSLWGRRQSQHPCVGYRSFCCGGLCAFQASGTCRFTPCFRAVRKVRMAQSTTVKPWQGSCSAQRRRTV
ncbi:putative glycogenin glucosyltransferase [Trypanosoma rangeli]|uniref:Putative glycogenin glucosyltransferase n=1 Tax=Trypanosoma rangeli TaxID=5698 RepID=A0A3S5IRM2_TRYRA|nr:putative glycogenin glucosyltransferase [Trypanosoma rangeli]RNF07589.1 putative glycogenin glucosyltransferase [Trypanosoma rangeli]|eukprot:RNF07589.1 putative glycogenin glucosyltransferase [Trypanosoma rangeli]